MPESAKWHVISDYPRNRSPYFRAIDEAAAAVGLPIAFAPALPRVTDEPGVVNPHRLKRLYGDWSGQRNREQLEAFFAHVDALRANGFPIVWTLHNLYPIDGAAIDECDEQATLGMLQRADAILCHTEADAAAVRELAANGAGVRVAGWAGLPSHDDITAATAELLAAIPDDRPLFLMLGNGTPYKERRRICEAFLAATTRGRLVVAGPSRDGDDELPSDDRLLVWNQRIEPSEAHHLLARASWAVCHYASRGRYAYFQRVLFPSSVSAAVCAGIPVIGPNLPSVREITTGHPSILYDDNDEALRRAFAEADEAPAEGRLHRARTDVTWRRWQQILTVYREVYEELCGSRCEA